MMKGFFNHVHAKYEQAGIKTFYTPQGNPVRFYNAFQSLNDVRNDVQALLIKPFTHFYLSNIYNSEAIYEFGLSLIHIASGSYECFTHLANMLYALACSTACYCAIVGEILIQTLSLVFRLAVTGQESLSKLTFKTATELEAQLVPVASI